MDIPRPRPARDETARAPRQNSPSAASLPVWFSLRSHAPAGRSGYANELTMCAARPATASPRPLAALPSRRFLLT